MPLRSIKLKRIEDLVNIAIASQIPVVHHLEIDRRHVYFVPLVGFSEISLIYYLELPEPVKGRYIVYNKFTGEISFSDKIVSDSRLSFLPIVEVEEQNAFSTRLFSQKKKKKHKEEKGRG